jgi:hypothetical protein
MGLRWSSWTQRRRLSQLESQHGADNSALLATTGIRVGLAPGRSMSQNLTSGFQKIAPVHGASTAGRGDPRRSGAHPPYFPNCPHVARLELSTPLFASHFRSEVSMRAIRSACLAASSNASARVAITSSPRLTVTQRWPERSIFITRTTQRNPEFEASISGMNEVPPASIEFSLMGIFRYALATDVICMIRSCYFYTAWSS